MFSERTIIASSVVRCGRLPKWFAGSRLRFDEVAQQFCDFAFQYLADGTFKGDRSVGIWFGVVGFVWFAQYYCERLFVGGWEVAGVHAHLC
jgi:hypothetical protein